MKPVPSPQQQETVHLEKLRSQLAADIELLQQKEASLRDYEQRLRGLIAQTDAAPTARSVSRAAAAPALAPTAAPFASTMPAAPDPAQNYQYRAASLSNHDLDTAWEKYHRAHALLEAARRGLVDDRLRLRDFEESLHQREADLSRRESWLRAREQELTTQIAADTASEAKARPSFTTAPFLFAKNILSPRRT